MLIVLSCPGCGKRYELDSKLAGKRARCRQCAQEFRVPTPRTGTSPVESESPTALEQPGAGARAAPPAPPGRTPAAASRPTAGATPRPGAWSDDEETVVDTDLIPKLIAEEAARAEEFALADPSPVVAPPNPYKKPLPDARAGNAGSRTFVALAVAGSLAALVFLGLLIVGLSFLFQDKATAEAAAALDATDGPDAVFFSAGAFTEVPASTMRDSVIAAHSMILDEVVAGFNAMTQHYNSVRDAASLAAVAPRIEDLSTRMAALHARESKITRPGPEEFERLSTKYRFQLQDATNGLRKQLERLQTIPKVGDRFAEHLQTFDQAVAQMDRELTPAIRSSPTDRTVWVRISQVDSGEACDAINAALGQLRDPDGSSFYSSRFESNRQVLYVNFGPVSDVKAMASKVSIGKVARVKGRALAVVARRLTTAELASARTAKHSASAGPSPPDLARADPAQPEKTPGAGSKTNTPAPSKPRAPAPRNNRPPNTPRRGAVTTLDGALAVLNDLAGHSRDELREAVRLISRQTPPARRKEVADGLGVALGSVDDDRFLRADVAKLLTRWAGPESVPALIAFLEREDFFGAKEVLIYLAGIKDPRCAEIFARYLGKQREPAIKGLVSLGPQGEAPALSALSSSDNNIRKSACDVLREIGTKEALAPLKALVVDPNQDVARAANSAIDAIESRTSATPPAASNEDRGAARKLDQVIKFLNESEPTFSAREPLDQAFRTMDSVPVDVKRAEVAKALERVLDAADRGMRAEAAKRIALRIGPENVDALVKFLKSEEFFGRIEVMAALTKLKDPRAALGFTFYLTKDRERAVAGLIALGPGAQAATLEYLTDKDDGARQGACDVLASIGTKESLPRIEPLVVDRNAMVTRSAERAIEMIEQREKMPVKGTSFERTAKRRTDQAISVLGTLDPSVPDRDKVMHLYRLLELAPAPARTADVAKALERWANTTDRGLLEETAVRLAPRAGKDNSATLAKMLQNDDFRGRVEIMEALARIKDPRAGEALALWLPRDRDRAARCIIALGSGAERAVHKYLLHSDGNVRRTACEILKEIGTQRSARVLEQASQDQNQDIARAAHDALQQANQRRAK